VFTKSVKTTQNREDKMKALTTGLIAGVTLLAASGAQAQLLETKSMSLAEAKKVSAAAEAEALKNNWRMACAVLDKGGAMVHYFRIDGTQIASTEIAVRKAKTAVMFNRPTKSFEDRMAQGANNLPTLHPALAASAGGVPITAGTELVGAIGCSGGTSDQDAQVATAGAGIVK
jgi:glc operon protein GlcG